MAVTRRGRAREPSLLERYGAQFAQLLEQKTSESALLTAQQEAQRNADHVLLAVGEAQFANELLKDEQRRLLLTESRLNYIATHDGLTGLPNRTLFNEKLDEAASGAVTSGGSVALFYVDLDYFNDVNETLGHEIGDTLLKDVAQRLLSCVEEGSVVGRLGSDTFVIMQIEEAAVPSKAKELAEYLVAELAVPHTISGHTIFVTASIGITTLPGDGADAALLHRNADVAMHRCKQEGRNGYQFFDALLDEAVQRRNFLEKALREALGNGEMSLVYQPQVSLQTRKITGVEALLRWNSSECGRVSPDEFIPIAERCGLIAELGAWVLRESCRQASSWDAAGLPPLTMAVNVSVPQLRLARLPDLVENVLQETGLLPSRLVLEITETEIMRDMRTSVETLTRLRNLGIKLAIDDFGTGYSSLSYLRRLPVDKIKIDKSFVTDVTLNVDAATIVSTIVTLARNLRLTVIVEGVETIEQERLLRDVGCHYAQGYYYGRPGSPADLIGRFARESIAV